jgi:hypothetical protein
MELKTIKKENLKVLIATPFSIFSYLVKAFNKRSKNFLNFLMLNKIFKFLKEETFVNIFKVLKILKGA